MAYRQQRLAESTCYSAARIHADAAGLRALSHSVNSVCPGFIESDMTAELNAEVSVCVDPRATYSLPDPARMPPPDDIGACVVGMLSHGCGAMWLLGLFAYHQSDMDTYTNTRASTWRRSRR